jgi:hypothetical protein
MHLCMYPLLERANHGLFLQEMSTLVVLRGELG